VPLTSADVSKSGRMLGYAPSVPMEEGLARFVKWLREGEAG
jgi:nucleoside-diphosphate-sugar epimerase